MRQINRRDPQITKLKRPVHHMLLRHKVAARMFAVLAREGINIDCISSSEMKVACVIAAAEVDHAVRAVHDEFFPQPGSVAAGSAG